MKNMTDKIDFIVNRLESIKSIISLVAEDIQDNCQSSALWGCVDLLNANTDKLTQISEECYKDEHNCSN